MTKLSGLTLLNDGRDIDRLVNIFGNELRVGESNLGKFIYDAVTGDTLDYFSQDELDAIISEGKTRPLDKLAGTVYTTINW